MLNIAILLKTQYFFGRHDQSNQYLIIWSACVDRYKKTRKLLLKYFSRCILHLFCSQDSKAGTKFFAQIKKKCLKFWIIIICFRLSYLNYICKTTVRDLCQLRFTNLFGKPIPTVWTLWLTVQFSFLKAFSH